MQINVFAMAAIGYGHAHPLEYDTRVELLTEPLASLARAAMTAGDLQTYREAQDAWWVSRAQLAAVAGFGRPLSDPADPYFVPPAARMQVCFLPEPITEEMLVSMPFQLAYLQAARRTADYLQRLLDAAPPRPFDLHVHRDAPITPLRVLAESSKLRCWPSNKGWWISSAEARAHLPAGESFTDRASAWYVDPLDHADQDEIQRFITEHRERWPEIYDGFLPGVLSRRPPDLDEAPAKFLEEGVVVASGVLAVAARD